MSIKQIMKDFVEQADEIAAVFVSDLTMEEKHDLLFCVTDDELNVEYELPDFYSEKELVVAYCEAVGCKAEKYRDILESMEPPKDK